MLGQQDTVTFGIHSFLVLGQHYSLLLSVRSAGNSNFWNSLLLSVRSAGHSNLWNSLLLCVGSARNNNSSSSSDFLGHTYPAKPSSITIHVSEDLCVIEIFILYCVVFTNETNPHSMCFKNTKPFHSSLNVPCQLKLNRIIY